MMEQIKQWLTEYGPPVVGVFVLLIVSWILASWIGRLVARALKRAHVEETLAKFLGNAARWTLLILAIIACLGVFGVQTASFAVFIGAGGLAVGLAFQGSLSNLAAGIMLLIYRPFKVGDVVNIGGNLGKIDDISLFCTNMDTPDNRRIILPNSSVFGAVIENITHHPGRRVDVAVGVEYSADIDQTRQALMKAPALVTQRLEDREPQIILLELGDSSLNWQVRIWSKTEDYWDARDTLTRACKVVLDEAGIGIPFPQMDVHLDSPVGSQG